MLMDGKMSRRSALGVLAGAALSTKQVDRAEAQTNKLDFLGSPLEQSQLETQKLTAVKELIEGFWKQSKAREHTLGSYFGGTKDRSEVTRALSAESRMYIPSNEKLKEIRDKSYPYLVELAKQIPEKKYGLFIEESEQVLYVLQNTGNNRIQFVKAYPVSASREEWSNAPGLKGTPTGLHRVGFGRKGMLGEVVSGRRDRSALFVEIREKNGPRRTFVRSLTSEGDRIPEIVTASLLIVGPSTRSTRGIYIHGTNRTNRLGRPDSGGCIRMSNVDVYDLLNYIEIGKLQTDEISAPGGTPVMLHKWQDAPKTPTQSKKESPTEKPAARPEVLTPQGEKEKTPKIRSKKDEDVIFFRREKE